MVISPPNNGTIVVVLTDDELIPENLNNEKVLIFRRGESTNRQLLMVKDLGVLADPSLVKPPDMPVCNYESGGPLHQHADKTWWYYDETWAFENGPFATQDIGADALQTYCESVLAERKDLTTDSKPDMVDEEVEE